MIPDWEVYSAIASPAEVNVNLDQLRRSIASNKSTKITISQLNLTNLGLRRKF